MKSFKLLAASLALICGQAFALPTWTDTVNPADRLITVASPYIFTFNITDGPNGFRPLIDTISDYSVSVNLYDDQDPWYLPFEIALVNMPGLGGSTTFEFLGGQEYGNVSIIGYLQLNLTGMLTVGIQSLFGDFYFGDATLNVNGTVAGTPTQGEVPEPGSLLLLGAALSAAAFASRRRKQ